MAHDITGIICSLQTTAVKRCRERLDEAAARSRDLISLGECGDAGAAGRAGPEYGVTSLLKRRHGL